MTPGTLLWQPDLRDARGPLYLAIVRQLTADIEGGRLHPGDRLPTQRRLAQALGVGLGTVTRAYKEAEEAGIVSSQVGRGTFVAETSGRDPLGLPDTAVIEMSVDLPIHAEDPDLAAALVRVARESGTQRLLRYQSHAGTARHRRAGAAWAGRFGMPASPDDVVVCAGTPHALCVALMATTRPGDVVLCDELSYPGIRAITTQLHLRLRGIPSSGPGEGLCLSALEAACKRYHVRALYTVPSIHNPTTVQLDRTKREGIARLAREHDFVILEDDVHRLLSSDPPVPIATLARDHGFYIASFSKAVCAGLRVAFLVPPPALVSRVTEAVRATAWGVAPLPVEVVATWIEDGTSDRVVQRKRAEAGERVRLCRKVLEGIEFDAQPNGYYAWVHLPEPWTSVELALQARADGVAVTPSSAFVVGQGAAPPAVRVCLAAPETREEARRGLTILRERIEAGPTR